MKEKLINNIIINIIKLNIKEEKYNINTINLLNYINNLKNKEIEIIKKINKNIEEMLEE